MSVLLLALAASARAEDATIGDISIKDPWIRGTVTGQQMTGLFMRIETAGGATLLGAKAPASLVGASEIHESRREKDIATMRAVGRIEIAAGQAVELKPGSYHVMLMDLKRALKEGETVPVRLRFEQGGKIREVEVKATVRKLDHAASHAH